MRSEREESEARVRMWRVEWVWMEVRALEARVAVGRWAREGRAMAERV